MITPTALKRLNRRIPNGTYGRVEGRLLDFRVASYPIGEEEDPLFTLV
ncbi:hypothetical protein [Paenibacillus barengoltzii]|nr:hypothetical protein [Paenibacillus barengoltzii]